MTPRLARWLIIIGATTLLASCGEKTPRLARLAETDVIVAFGDSLTYGTGAPEHESYPAVLSQLVGRTVVRSGVPGEMTADGLKRLPEVLDEHRPRLVIVCLGGNDMLRKVEKSRIKANLREIVRTIRARGIDVVLVGVPQPSLITSAPEFYAEIAEEFNVPYEGRIVTSVLYSPELKSDPIHPNARGYRRMAEAIAELLRRSGAL
jgi:lysophospholipase L1-like esterase